MNAHSKSVQEPRDISQEVNERVARPTGGGGGGGVEKKKKNKGEK